jgi:hypothetical protein
MANHVLQKNQGKVCFTVWAIVRDNMPVVPDSVKNLLWDEILKHFTLPEGLEPANVKRWTLTRMATQFQKFKQQLNKDYIKKNQTPNWIEYPKLKEHWTSFVEYKKSEDFAKASAQGKQVVLRRSTAITLVEVDMHLQCPSGRRWKKTFSHKVPYLQSLIGPSE